MADHYMLLGYATHDKVKGEGVYPIDFNLKRANRHGLVAAAPRGPVKRSRCRRWPRVLRNRVCRYL